MFSGEVDARGPRCQRRPRLAVGLFYISLYAVPIGYFAEGLFGWPAWLLFRRYGVRSVFAFTTCGAGIGFLVALLMALLFGRGSEPLDFYTWFPVLSATVSAAAFRVVLFSGKAVQKA